MLMVNTFGKRARKVIRFLRKGWFVVLVLIGGFVAFDAASQSKDVFVGLSVDPVEQSLWHVLFVYLFMFTWSLSVWYSMRLILTTKGKNKWAEEEPSEVRSRNKAALWVGAAPYLIISLGFILPDYPQGEMLFILYSFGALVLGVFYVWLIRRVYQLNIDTKIEINRSQSSLFVLKDEVQGFKSLGRYYVTSFVLSIVTLLMMSYMPFGIWFSIAIGPLALFLLALTYLTIISGFLSWFAQRHSFPTGIVSLVWILFMSACNDNNDFRVLMGPNDVPKEKIEIAKEEASVKYQFDKWKNHESRKGLKTVFVVAGQGGGSRASFWTGNNLAKLNESIPNFYSNVFAISSVSGSSAGSGFYNALCYDAIKKGEYQNKAAISQKTREVTGADYLSPNTAGTLFPEIIQSISPFGIPPFDRSRYLEDAWSNEFESVTGTEFLEDPFDQLYSDKSSSYLLPFNVFNTTVIETGGKSLISVIKPSDERKRSKILHLNQELKQGQIPMKVAMSLSARFPAFTSAGTFETKNGSSDSLSIADGGYYENSGMETAVEIIDELIEYRRERLESEQDSFNIVLLFIENSNSEQEKDKSVQHFLSILQTPLNGLINTWGTEDEPMQDYVQQYFSQIRMIDSIPGDTLVKISLNYREGEYYPLSRFISEHTKGNMISQIEEMIIRADELDELQISEDSLTKYKETIEYNNACTFSFLKEQSAKNR